MTMKSFSRPQLLISIAMMFWKKVANPVGTKGTFFKLKLQSFNQHTLMFSPEVLAVLVESFMQQILN